MMNNLKARRSDLRSETLPRLEEELVVEFDPERRLINPIKHLKDQRFHAVFDKSFEMGPEGAESDELGNQWIRQLLENVSLNKRIRVGSEESGQVLAEQAQEFGEGVAGAVRGSGGRIENILKLTFKL